MSKNQAFNIDEYQKKLISLLRRLFRIEDFGDYGIFRIMQFKKERINRFIEIELSQIIDTALKEVSSSFQKEIKTAIFSGIFQFFSSYYQKGDLFHVRKFSKENKYMIPYNGEETLLHWVHKDYYYIKTEENNRNFTFRSDQYTIHFYLSEKMNPDNKEQYSEPVINLRDLPNIQYNSQTKCLEIFFIRQSIQELPKLKKGESLQDHILVKIYEAIINQIPDPILQNSLRNVANRKDTPRLMEYLRIFMHRNTADFFIHRNLPSFLLNELDYFIKHELLDLNFFLQNPDPHKLLPIKVIQKVCTQIIVFLSQIENFEKILWEKKPFIIKSEYCLTLDKVPDNLLEEVFLNEGQIQQWEREFLINLSSLPRPIVKTKNKNKMNQIREDIKQLLSTLCNYENLVVDTKFYSQEFKQKLITSFKDIESEIQGLCIKSENWRALNFLMQKYRHQIKCIYIDPPYNTGADDFIYKDHYQHSSWLTMMANRLELAREFLKDDGIFFCSIDDHEEPYLSQLIENTFGYKLDNIIWHKKTQPSFLSKEIINVTEYIIPAKITANMVPMVGGFGDKEKLAELINQSNDIAERVLPRNHVLFGNQWTGTITVGEYGKGTLKIRVVEPLKITKGIADRDIHLIGRFKWTQETINAEISKGGQIFIKSIKSMRPTMKRVFDNEIIKAPITLLSKKINEIPTNTDATNELKELFGISPFDYPKPAGLLKYLYRATTYFDPDAQILDFFAGSGTTTQSVLELNAEDDGDRKYIVVELSDVFETVILPRIRKLMYSQVWKEGKPVQSKGYSHCFQYIYLEQFVDTLNNLELTDNVTTQKYIENLPNFFLQYMLDIETNKSPSRLNTEKFQSPWNYMMKIANSGSVQAIPIDLPETFNFLFGVSIRTKLYLHSQNRTYLIINGLRNNHEITIIWRETVTLDIMADKDFIEKLSHERKIAKELYINSPCCVAGARFIELEFRKLI